MSNHCLSRNCESIRGVTNVSFHKFPDRDRSPGRFNAWKLATDEEDKTIGWNDSLCAKHFNKSDYTEHSNRLLKSAIPSIYPGAFCRSWNGEKIELLEKELTSKRDAMEELAARAEANERLAAELEKQAKGAREDATRGLQSLRRVETDLEEMKRSRDAAADERDSLVGSLQRRDAEIQRLKAELEELSGRLREEISAKCSALADRSELQSARAEAEDREARAEQSRSLLERQMNVVNGELSNVTDQLQTVRMQHNARLLSLESDLSSKTESLRDSEETIANLKDVNNRLSAKVETLSQQILDIRDQESQLYRNFKEEVEAKERLVEIYKSVKGDADSKNKELEEAVFGLQRLLKDATEKYGELETNKTRMEEENEEMIESKNKLIVTLKAELDTANEVMKAASDQNLDKFVSELSPAAAAASKLLKSGMTLTQVYNQLVHLTDELSAEKNINRSLQDTITSILTELEQKAPEMKQMKTDRDQLYESNTAMTVQLESLVDECNSLRSECSQANQLANHYTKETMRCKEEIKDLSRQVCYLLKEVEQFKGGSVSSSFQDSPNVTSKSTNSSDLSSSHLISKSLVTFSTLQELQENNRKLLRVVRELTVKQEEAERNASLVNSGELQSKLENCQIRINELTEGQERQTKVLEGLARQRDMYKKLYHDKSGGKDDDVLNRSSESQNHSAPRQAATPEGSSKSVEFEKLQVRFTQTEKQLTELKEEFKIYKEEIKKSERMVNEEMDRIRKLNDKLTNENGKCMSTQEYNNERFKIFQANTTTYKKQIATLEERSKSEKIIHAKQEMLIKQLQDELMKCQASLSGAQVSLENVRQECKLYKDSECRLKAERDMLTRERQSQALIMNSLEMIKTSVSRNQTDDQIRLENKLEDTERERNAFRLRLQEEQDEHTETRKQLQAKYDSTLSRLEEEKKIAIQLRQDLEVSRTQVEEKNKHIDEFTSKLKDVKHPTSSSDVGIDLSKIRDLENVISAKTNELTSLQKDFESTKSHIEQYRTIADNFEKEMKTIYDSHTEYKDKMEKQHAELQQSELQLRERCAELEAELSLQSNGQYSKETDLTGQLVELTKKLAATQKELDDKSKDLKEAREEATKLAEAVETAERKYKHEMMLHADDLKLLDSVQEKFNALSREIGDATSAKTQAIANLEESQKSWSEREKKMISDAEEINGRLADLTAQNSALHDQIETLTSRLTVAHSSSGADVANESTGEVSLDRSINEDDAKSSKQLLAIIKYLRKERDVAMAKFDMQQAEARRLRAQSEMTSKKLDEAKLELSKARETSEAGASTAVKHTDLLRKVETLNAMTDSNRLLREERDELEARVERLTVATRRLEDELAPLQRSNGELTARTAALQSEATAAQSEATRWRTRCGALVERANKNSPEDWKRLQNERETLAKMLSVERDGVKRLNEELSSLGLLKSNLEERLADAKRKGSAAAEETERLTEELNAVKSDVSRISRELEDSRKALSEATEERAKLSDCLASTEKDLADVRNKEMQIRKIAKKYKTQFEELTKTVEESRKKSESDSAAGDALEGELKAAREANDRLRQELEKLRGENQDKDEKAKNVLKQAKNKIMQLTEAKTNVANQLLEAQKKIESFAQSRDENDVRLTALKSQYEGRLARCEKERAEAIAERAKEADAMQQKIALLQRLASAPAAKVATADKAPGDTPTANIKPMAGPATARGRAGDPALPLASVRPTAAVPPSSPAAAAPPTAVAVSVAAAPHATEYMPASSSRPLQGADAAAPTADAPVPAAVALVLPRVEGEAEAARAQAPSSSGGASAAAGAQAQRAKRPRPPPAPGPAAAAAQSAPKRSRLGFERSVEVEYQVPTSSRCDREDDGVIVVDSDAEDDDADVCSGAPDDVDEEADDAPDGDDSEAEDDDDDDEAVEEEDDDAEADAEMGSGGEDAEGEAEAGSGGGAEAEAATEAPSGGAEAEASASREPPAPSSAEEGGGDAAAGGAEAAATATPRRALADAAAAGGAYEEHDDGIVPCTPTLYVPRRADGFGEAVSSPGAGGGSGAATTGRFTFAPPALDDTHADLAAQLPHRDVPSIVVGEAEEAEGGGAETGSGDDSAQVSSQVAEEGREAEAGPAAGAAATGAAAAAAGASVSPSAVPSPRRGTPFSHRGSRRPFRPTPPHRPAPISWPHQQDGRDMRGGVRPRRPYR